MPKSQKKSKKSKKHFKKTKKRQKGSAIGGDPVAPRGGATSGGSGRGGAGRQLRYKFGPHGARWHKCTLIKTNGNYYY